MSKELVEMLSMLKYLSSVELIDLSFSYSLCRYAGPGNQYF